MRASRFQIFFTVSRKLRGKRPARKKNNYHNKNDATYNIASYHVREQPWNKKRTRAKEMVPFLLKMVSSSSVLDTQFIISSMYWKIKEKRTGCQTSFLFLLDIVTVCCYCRCCSSSCRCSCFVNGVLLLKFWMSTSLCHCCFAVVGGRRVFCCVANITYFTGRQRSWLRVFLFVLPQIRVPVITQTPHT